MNKSKLKKVPYLPKFTEEDEENADKAATQYIELELKRGNPVNESIIRKRSLKEKWTPNLTPEEEYEMKRK